MKIVVIVFVILFLVVAALLFYAANFLFNGILDRHNSWFDDVAHSLVNTDINADHDAEIAQREQAQLDAGELLWANADERCTITSFDGLKLHGRLVKSQTPSDKWFICFHGYRTSGKVDAGYLSSELIKDGYNSLIVDQRAHGESEGRYITMGWLERQDVLTWTDFLIEEKAPSEIIWFGDSMGAATVLMASGERVPDVVHGIIADCGYTSIPALFNFLLNSAFNVPTWVPIIPTFSLLTKQRLGFSVYEASAQKQLQKNNLPILFIHGDADTFVPLTMSEQNMAATKGEKELVVVKDAPHFSSILFDPERYFSSIKSFLTKYSHIYKNDSLLK